MFADFCWLAGAVSIYASYSFKLWVFLNTKNKEKRIKEKRKIIEEEKRGKKKKKREVKRRREEKEQRKRALSWLSQ